MNNNIILGSDIPMPRDPKKVFDFVAKLVRAGKKLLKIVFGDGGVGRTAPMDEKKSTVDDIMQLNSLLLQYKETVSNESKEVEVEVKNVCKSVFDQIIESVEFANSELKFYRTEVVERKINRFLSEIDGFFARSVSTRISLDDPECISILKMLPGELKEQRMIELKKRVLQDSLEDLCRIIETFYLELIDGVETSVEDKLISFENTIEERKTKFEIITSKTESCERNKSMINIEARYKASIIGIAPMILEGDN